MGASLGVGVGQQRVSVFLQVAFELHVICQSV